MNAEVQVVTPRFVASWTDRHVDMLILNEKTKNYKIKMNALMPKSRMTDMYRIVHVLRNIEGVNPFERFGGQRGRQVQAHR